MITRGKRIVLGVTGSIACYKAVEILSRLIQQEAEVDVVMTESATRFVSPLTFSSLSRRPVKTSLWEEGHINHIELAAKAHAILIAPASANTLARLASGEASDLLSAVVLATRSPVILAPAMEANMYTNPLTQANLSRLREQGFVVVDPEYGWLASGGRGQGRLAGADQIIGTLRKTLGRKGPLSGTRVVVTAGGTREAIDVVRFISNRSSGKMGYALAEAARDHGAEVILITAPTHLSPPAGIEVIGVEGATDMQREVNQVVKADDILIMAAAVADYRPQQASKDKIRRQGPLTLELQPTPDILATVPEDVLKVGFAAEEGALLQQAQAKLLAKKADMIVATDITRRDSGFEVDNIQVSILEGTGHVEELPLLPKEEVAEIIINRILQMKGQTT